MVAHEAGGARGGWGRNGLIKYPEGFVRSECKDEVLAAQGFPNIQHHFFSFSGPSQGSCLSAHLFSQPHLHALKPPSFPASVCHNYCFNFSKLERGKW